MIEIEIADLLNQEHLRLQDLARKIGVSISLLSRIKNGEYAITKNVQTKFQAVYPDYVLIGSAIKWKTKYENAMEEIAQLQNEIQFLNAKIDNALETNKEMEKLVERNNNILRM